jgi:adenylate cyclase
MINRDADSPAQVQPKWLRFGNYALDLDRGCLLGDGNEIALRPKTFAVLCYLVENACRLISKDELFAAVWPNVVVTDDALVQSVGELRRALGDDGQRLIKTIPRRGYRFEHDVSVADTQPSANAAPGLADSGGNSPDNSPDLAPSQAPNNSGPALGAPVAAWRAGRRYVISACLVLVLLVVAGVLWSSLGTDRKSFGIPWYANRSPAKSSQLEAKPAIAILPFANQSGDSTREYFADGLTQDVINALGRFSALTVMSWNAVLPYKNRPASPGQIARSLAVRYQVEGNILQTGDRVRLIPNLIDQNL